ncbi:MAG: FAD:protein FMN transferase [Nitrospirota bacterium]
MRAESRTQNPENRLKDIKINFNFIHPGFVVCILCSVFCVLFFPACTKRDQMYKESRVLMDTYCTITVVSPSKEKAREAIDAGYAEIQKLDKYLNNFEPDSEISTISKSAGDKPVQVSQETLDLVKKTIGISADTGGAFDPTIAPVLKLWKFSGRPAAPTLPPDDAIKTVLKAVDYRKIKVSGESSEIRLEDAGMELDLGGIAKGYAADRAVGAIKSKGIKAALVAIAGDIRGYGLSRSGNAWKVGIQDPRPEKESDKPWEDVFASVYLEDRAVSTAGDYQRFFFRDGKRYHHIIDPATGYPSDSGLISVSVIAPEGYIADGIDTAILILGAEKGIKLLESKGIDGVLVTSDKRVLITKNLRDKVEILKKGYLLYN